MRSAVGLIIGWLVGFATTALLIVVATGLLYTASSASRGSLVGRSQVLVAEAVSLLFGSFMGALVGGRWIKTSGRTWFGLLVGLLLLATTVLVVVVTGIRRGGELLSDPVAYMVVPLAAALVGGLVGVALAKPRDSGK